LKDVILDGYSAMPVPAISDRGKLKQNQCKFDRLDLIKGITGIFENGLNIISIYPKIE
jgi:hypothetical protein